MDLKQLIGLFEIAEIANVSPAAVGNWRKRFSDFPQPVAQLKSGPVFQYSQIKNWLIKRKGGGMAKVISFFNNKGGVGKTTTIWNLAVSLAETNKNILLIDFDPQCNLSIAMLGAKEFGKCLSTSKKNPYGKTIRSFALPYIQQSKPGQVFVSQPLSLPSTGGLDIVPSDFWLNNFSDILNVGTDVIGGAGLYRFLLPMILVETIEKELDKTYDYVLIDLPPSFNSLVRSALYCSDYFLVPCTPDLFSAYCVGLIGQVLPSFIIDWEQGKQRYMQSNEFDTTIPEKGQPKFGGWIFNGFDTRKKSGTTKKAKTGADRAQFEKVSSAVKDDLIPKLNKITAYKSVPKFTPLEPVANIEDLNVMAPDSIVQNVPIKYLQQKPPTRDIGRGTWAKNQKDLMSEMDKEYDRLAQYINKNF